MQIPQNSNQNDDIEKYRSYMRKRMENQTDDKDQ